MGKTLETTQNEDFTLVIGQLSQGAAEERNIVAIGGAIIGSRTFVGVLMESDRIGDLRRLFAVMRGDRLAGHVVQPGAEVSFVAVSVPVFEDAFENNLNQVLAQRAMPGEIDKETVKPAVVTFKKLAELIEVAIANGEHEVVVVSRVHRVAG